MRIRCLLRAALVEFKSALRSRRAIVVLVLYLAASLLCMNGSISLLGRLENQLTEVLQLPQDAARAGVVSQALWKSKSFQKMVRKGSGDVLVYNDISGRHPAELMYALFAFWYVPLLTVLMATPRVAEDLQSGVVRYMVVRVTRLEWSLGKFVGIGMLLLAGLLVGGVGGWVVATLRLGAANAAPLFLPMIGWSLKAWPVALSWLGISLGLSHLFHSGSKATSCGLIALVLFTLMPKLLSWVAGLAPALAGIVILERLLPFEVAAGLWRNSLAPIVCSSLWLLALGLMFFGFGFAAFQRRDAR